MPDELDRAMNRVVTRAAQKAQAVIEAEISKYWEPVLDYEVWVAVRSPARVWEHRIATRLREADEGGETDG